MRLPSANLPSVAGSIDAMRSNHASPPTVDSTVLQGFAASATGSGGPSLPLWLD
jgi:hypothetical protein